MALNAAFAAAAESFWEQSAARRLILHFGGATTYRVKFYAHTPRDELLAGMREVLGVRPGTPLRFRDADGDIVLITSALPDGTVLHVAVEEGAPAPAAAATPAAGAIVGGAVATTAAAAAEVATTTNWQRWAFTFSACGKAVATETSFVVDDGSGNNLEAFWAFSGDIPTGGGGGGGGGPLYGTLDFAGRKPCCVWLGLVPASRASMPESHLDEEEYPFMVELRNVGYGPTGGGSRIEPGGTVGIYVDPAKKQLVIVDHEKPKLGAIRIDFTLEPPYKVALQGPKHAIDATWSRKPLPAGGVDTSNAALLSRDKASKA